MPRLLLLLALLSTPCHAAGDEPALRSAAGPDGRTVIHEFPALPETLWSQVAGAQTGEHPPPSAAVRVPKGADSGNPAPLVIFLGGAHGSSGRHTHLPDEITAGLRVITGALPLFKEQLAPLRGDESNKWSRLILSPADIRLIGRSWEPMLDKIFASTDGIAAGQAVIGGFSNGAHSVAGVLNDPGLRHILLRRFRRFVFVEGGSRLAPGPHLAGCSFLLMEGETGSRPLAHLPGPLRDAGAAVEHRVMRGIGHDLPASGHEIIRAWLRRELFAEGATRSSG